MKKIIIAIDSFKGCLTSAEAGKAAEKGIKSINPSCHTSVIPIADGGEGLLDVLIRATKGKYITLSAHGPLMKMAKTHYGLSGNGRTAIIEMAAISGLPLVPIEQRNPMLTTTFGTGELIKDALNKGCRNFIIGIGGSATNDAGLGMLQALGFRFLDKSGHTLGTGGQIMEAVANIDTSGIQPGTELLLKAIDFSEKIKGADLIITGEGKADRQTAMGKVPYGILKEAQKEHIPVIVLAGSIENLPELNKAGFKGIFSIAPGPITLEKAMEPEFAKENITRLVSQLYSVITSFG